MQIVKKNKPQQIGLRESIIAYWSLQFLKAYKIKFPTEGQNIIYTCLHIHII